MLNIEITFTNSPKGDVWSWDVYSLEDHTQAELGAYIGRLRRRYPTYSWEMRDTGAPKTTTIFAV